MQVGDSVSIGQVDIGKLFDQLETRSVAQPVHSPGNACNANRGKHCIANWTTTSQKAHRTTTQCGFDMISFNFGIHDVNHDQVGLTMPLE